MLNKFRKVSSSPGFLLLSFAITAVALLGDQALAMPCMICLAMIIALVLFLNDDLFPTLLPFLCILLIGTTMIGGLEFVLPYIPFGIPAVLGFLFHLVAYRRPFRGGTSLPGLFATSAAILLGGSGVVATQQAIFNGAAAYHLIGLSLGLLFCYYLFATNPRPGRSYDPIKYFLLVMLLLGMLCATLTLSNFLSWILPAVREGKVPLALDYLTGFIYRNTIANLLIMCLPAGFYFAGIREASLAQKVGSLLLGGFMFFALLLTCARTALLFGSILFVLCLIYYLWAPISWRTKLICLSVLLITGLVLFLIFRETIYSLLFERLEHGLVLKKEPRFLLLKRSIEDFRSYPIFGIGLDSTANHDLYDASAAQGCIAWYHMYFPQLWGSMGLFGMIAFAYQLVLRIKIILTKPDYQSMGLTLSYLGLFLYSQTDPGEFIPLPFAFLAVLIFVLLENRNKKNAPLRIDPPRRSGWHE